MAADCDLYLPPDVPVDSVAKAIGILAGLKPEKMYPANIVGIGAWLVRVPGTEIRICEGQPSCVQIIMQWIGDKPGGLIDGETTHRAFWTWESCHQKYSSYRTMIVRSTPFWIATCRRLADFFGGYVHYNDCGGNENADYFAIHSRWNNPQDGQEWQDKQERLFNILPLTKQDIDDCRKWAAYPYK